MTNIDDLFDLDSRDEDTADRYHKHMKYALRFAKVYGDKLLHVRGIGWHRWNGTHWEVCENGAESRAVRKLVQAALVKIAKMQDPDKRKPLLNEALAIETKPGVEGVLGLAKAEHPIGVSIKDLDAGAHLLNTPTGILDLNTGELVDCDPAARLTKITGAAFDPDARSDDFDKFLERIQPDPEIRSFLARSIGAAMFGEVREHVLHIWHGQGANGKGTLRDAIRHALGAYVIEVDTSILIASKQGGSDSAVAAERMKLLGARLAFCSEVSKDAKLNEAVMKRLTGGDPIPAKLLYENPVTFDPTHQLLMLSNFLPEVSGDDPAVWRRMVATPFLTNIPEEEWDMDLKTKLAAAGPSVLAWAYRGWLEYQEKGLAIPDVVRAYTSAYKSEQDALARFLDECTVTGQGCSVQAGRLFSEWQDFCTREGIISGTKTAFGKSMRGRKFVAEKAGTMVYRGIGLVAPEKDDDDRTHTEAWASQRRSA